VDEVVLHRVYEQFDLLHRHPGLYLLKDLQAKEGVASCETQSIYRGCGCASARSVHMVGIQTSAGGHTDEC
jgi:hypothetical protein